MRDRHIYDQSTGWWDDASETVIYKAYAGRGEGRNNPAMDNVPNTGPLPRGLYTIEPLVDKVGAQGYGPGYMRLTPSKNNVMYGRFGFLIHWNTHDHDPYDRIFPSDASHGCIVLLDGANIARIAASPIRLLEVVA